MGATSSLNGKLHWLELEPVLELRPVSQQLPTLATCPVCHSQDKLEISDDPRRAGQWTFCRHCGTAGDLIQLASKAWKAPIADTVARLLRYSAKLATTDPSEEEITKYQGTCVHVSEIVADYWEEVQQRVRRGGSETLANLQRATALYVDALLTADRIRWLYGYGNVCELASIVEEYTWRSKRGRRSVRHGPGALWREALLFPSYDAPWRICGFVAVDGEIGMPRRFSYWSTYGGAEARQAGVCFMEALLQPRPPGLEHVIFIADNPDLVARMHLRFAKDNVTTLPLVSTYYGSDALSDNFTLPQAQYVLLTARPTAETFRLARRLDASIVRTAKAVDTHSEPSPLMWLRRMLKNALPWQNFLHTHLAQQSMEEAEMILLRAALDQGELAEALTSFSPTIREALQQRLSPAVGKKPVRIKYQDLVETASGWALIKTDEVICNAKLRIDEVVYHEESKETFYRGRILFEGREIEFFENARDVDPKPFIWMRTKLLSDPLTKGVFQFNPSWAKYAVAIAQQFQAPTKRIIDGVVGFDPKSEAVIFPTFAIADGGEIKLQQYALTHTNNAPQAHLAPPDQLAFSGLDLLGVDSMPMRFFWATSVAVLYNLLAPALKWEPVPVAVVGKGIWPVFRALSARLGCYQPVLTNRNYKLALNSLFEAAASRGWPACIGASCNNAALTTFLVDKSPKNVFVELDATTADMLVLGYGWTVLTGSEEVMAATFADGLEQFLPYYILDLQRRHRRFSYEGSWRPLQLCRDLSDWYEAQTGKEASVIRESSEFLPTSSPPAWRHFFRLISELCARNLLPVARAGYGNDHGILENKEEGWLAVHQDAFLRALRKQGAIPIEAKTITEAIQDSQEGYQTERLVNGQMAWIFDLAWWKVVNQPARSGRIRPYLKHLKVVSE